jgi:hypothetical protein
VVLQIEASLQYPIESGQFATASTTADSRARQGIPKLHNIVIKTSLRGEASNDGMGPLSPANCATAVSALGLC